MAQELGYRRNALARSLRRSGNGVAATVMYNMPNARSSRRPTSFWEEALFGYVQEFARAGIGNVLVPADEAATLIQELPADVVVVLNVPHGEDPIVEVPGGVPTLRAVFGAEPSFVNQPAPSGTATAFIIWNYDAALDAVFRHLLDCGARFPGLLLPPRPLAPAALIRQAHEQWCLSHDLPVLFSASRDIEAGTRELLDRNCDGLLVHGDNGVGDVDLVLQTIRATDRRVPQDVLLVSISDGAREARMEPPVTCLSYEGMSSGVQMARAVIDGLTTGQFRDVVIDWGLRIRESTVGVIAVSK